MGFKLLEITKNIMALEIYATGLKIFELNFAQIRCFVVKSLYMLFLVFNKLHVNSIKSDNRLLKGAFITTLIIL